MKKKELENKYRDLEKRYDENESKLKNIYNSRLFYYVEKLPLKISKWLLEPKKESKKNSKEETKVIANEKINDISLNSKLKNISKSFLDIVKKVFFHINIKIKEIRYIKSSNAKLIKTINTEIYNNENNLVKDEIAIIIIFDDIEKNKCDIVYKILHQSYINFKIYIINKSETKNEILENIDSRIVFLNKELIEKDIMDYLEKNIFSQFVIITNYGDNINIKIKNIVKLLNKNYSIIDSKNQDFEKYFICFKKENLSFVADEIKDKVKL